MRALLLQEISAVESVALRGDVAGIGDDAAQFGFVGAIADAGCVHHIFFNQDAAYIVGAELQAELADFNSWSEPARLNVIDVVEIHAADRQRL